MLTVDQLQPQVSAPELQPGLINPSRSITKEDETYLRDYTLAAEVISWDESLFNTPLQVTAGDITNIAIAGDTVWYQINYYRAIPLNIEIFHAHRQQIQLYKAQLDAQEECQPLKEPLPARDSVRDRLLSNTEATEEFEIGRRKGQHDAAVRLQPICSEATCPYSAGYLDGGCVAKTSDSLVKVAIVPTAFCPLSLSMNPKHPYGHFARAGGTPQRAIASRLRRETRLQRWTHRTASVLSNGVTSNQT